jgi:hypothetical protein
LDIAPSGWVQGLLTFLGGYAARALSEWLQYRRATKKDREAREELRRDKLYERRIAFQRQTLLDLQEATLQLARTVGAAHFQDEEAFRTTGKWGDHLFPDDLDENNRLAHARTYMLGVRVRDDAARELMMKFKMYGDDVLKAKTRADSENAFGAMTAALDDLNQRVGEVLRSLDDIEQV